MGGVRPYRTWSMDALVEFYNLIVDVVYASTASARSGLLLGIATSPQKRIEASCDRLIQIIERVR
jgi:hypothetical protein